MPNRGQKNKFWGLDKGSAPRYAFCRIAGEPKPQEGGAAAANLKPQKGADDHNGKANPLNGRPRRHSVLERGSGRQGWREDVPGTVPDSRQSPGVREMGAEPFRSHGSGWQG